MRHKFTILTTPYYVEHTNGFDTKPLATKPNGEKILSRPFVGSTLIAFKSMRHDGMQRVVIMGENKVWQFDPGGCREHFEIKNKVPSLLMHDAISEIEEGNEITILYNENV